MLRCRVDDFPGTKPEEFWRHNLDNFRRFDAVMERHGLDYVLGVIPRHTTDAQLRALASMPLCEVAMHGVRHDERYLDEFNWETSVEIERALRSAKLPLDEICGPVKHYIPPHNALSEKTVVPLALVGFDTVHAGPGSNPDVLHFAEKTGLRVHEIYPPHQYGRSDELLERGAVAFFEEMRQDAGAMIFDTWLGLHWTWEWNVGLENLDKFLTEIQKAIDAGRKL